jgi:cytochrome c oxidase assembly protein subunit 15
MTAAPNGALGKTIKQETTVNHTGYHPWLHRIAVLTACLALLPVLMGALVTTKDAGMAFPDWPNSDGHNMLLYPWLKSAGAKFLEHGHRLAGILIGVASIALAVTAWRLEPRRWVKWLACGVLVAVISQGILGGQRVLLDERGLAFVHGSFAALVLALMASVAVVTSRNWHVMTPCHASLTRLKALALVTCGCVFIQYVLGGLLRHQGRVLFEHLGFAFVAASMVIWLAMAATASGNAWLRRPAICLAVLTIGQLALGAGAWITKYGFDGRVAVYGSLEQDVTRTAHVLCGMLLFVTSVVLTVRIARLQRLSSSAWPGLERSEGPAGEESWRRPNHGNLTTRLTNVHTPLAGGAR